MNVLVMFVFITLIFTLFNHILTFHLNIFITGNYIVQVRIYYQRILLPVICMNKCSYFQQHSVIKGKTWYCTNLVYHKYQHLNNQSLAHLSRGLKRAFLIVFFGIYLFEPQVLNKLESLLYRQAFIQVFFNWFSGSKQRGPTLAKTGVNSFTH